MTSYAGKTNNFRLRTNGHKSCCNTGNTSDRFDKHVFNCRRKHGVTGEPLFSVFIFVEVFDDKLLLLYENYIHKLGFDTMNRP